MVRLSDVFNQMNAASQLWFFEELDICIYAKNTFTKIITLSTEDSWKIDLKYVYHAISSAKYKKIFLLNNTKNDRATITAISVEQKTYKKLNAFVLTDTKCSFISKDEQYIILIDARGKVVKINIDNLQSETVIELKEYINSEYVCRFGFFHLANPWYDCGNDIYANYVRVENENSYSEEKKAKLELKKYEEYRLDVFNKKIEVIPLKSLTHNMFTNVFNNDVIPRHHHCKELDLDIYVAFKYSTNNLSYVTCEFQRNGNYLFHFDTEAELIATPIIEYYKENKILICCNAYGIYLCDIGKQNLKYLNIPEGGINNMFLYRKNELIILTYVDRPTKECYTIDDFKESDIVCQQLIDRDNR